MALPGLLAGIKEKFRMRPLLLQSMKIKEPAASVVIIFLDFL